MTTEEDLDKVWQNIQFPERPGLSHEGEEAFRRIESQLRSLTEENERLRSVVELSRSLTVTLHEQATMDYDAALAAFDEREER